MGKMRMRIRIRRRNRIDYRFARPHLVILDESTKHLDVEGIEQLEHQLIAGASGCIFVSHDRRFVARVATRTFFGKRVVGWGARY